MRIGVIRDEAIVNSVYRAALPMGELEARGHEVHWADNTRRALDVPALRRCDAVFIHRQFDAYMQQVAGHLRSQGVALWWDNDDDITALPRSDPMYRSIGGTRGTRIFQGMTRMMQMADTVTTPSRVLAQRYRSMGVNQVQVLENYIADEFARMAKAPRRNAATVQVGWFAGLEHRFDADRLQLRETFTRLLDAHPQVHVTTVGVGLGLGERYTHLRGLSLYDLALTASSFDIGIAPIVDAQMNQARSNLKVKEYAVLGVPWLASPIGPYSGLGEQEGGRLVADDAWFERLSELVVDARGRGKLAKRATKWGAKQTIGRNASRWEAVLEETVARARRRTS